MTQRTVLILAAFAACAVTGAASAQISNDREARRHQRPGEHLFGRGRLRRRGRGAHGGGGFRRQVKTPAESKYPWDYYKVIGTVPTKEAALPLSRSECNLVKKTN
jgi:hypothetical protein